MIGQGYSSIPRDNLVLESKLNGTGNSTVGNNGTATNPSWLTHTKVMFVKQYLDLVSGSSAKVAYGNIGNIKSVSLLVNLDTTTENIFEGASNNLELYANAGTLTYPDWDNVYVDNVDTDTITTGWKHIVLTSTTDISCTAFTLGLINATYGDFNCNFLRCYSTELNNSERDALFLEASGKLGQY